MEWYKSIRGLDRVSRSLSPSLSPIPEVDSLLEGITPLVPSEAPPATEPPTKPPPTSSDEEESGAIVLTVQAQVHAPADMETPPGRRQVEPELRAEEIPPPEITEEMRAAQTEMEMKIPAALSTPVSQVLRQIQVKAVQERDKKSNKLSSVNDTDTYVLKNKIPEKVETDDDDDSSCGLLSPNTTVDGDLLDADNKCTKTFALQEFDYKIRRMSEISNLLDNIEKQRVEITDILENFKVRPIHIPEKFTIPEKSSSYNATGSEEVSVALPSLEEKIRKHQESCKNCWKLEIVEGDFYHFSTLYGSLVLVMQLDLESGRVINLETRNKLRENAKPISRYIMTFFLDKLSESHIKCAIGDHCDVLSLLDYVLMTMLGIHSFLKEFKTCGLTMEEDFVAKYSICSVPLALSCEIFVDVADLENSKPEKDIRIATNIGVINETEIKEIVKFCPKGLDFFLSFCQNIRKYLEVKEKREGEKPTTKRRSSILKMPKARNPFENIDTTETYTDINFSKSVRRVSFASSNFIRPFVADPEKNTIWDTTCEEDINHTNSTQSQSSQEHILNGGTKLGFTLFDSVTSRVSNMTNRFECDMELTKTVSFIDKENIPVCPSKKISINREYGCHVPDGTILQEMDRSKKLENKENQYETVDMQCTLIPKRKSHMGKAPKSAEVSHIPVRTKVADVSPPDRSRTKRAESELKKNTNIAKTLFQHKSPNLSTFTHDLSQKTPESSFHINFTNVSCGIDDTQHLLQCTYSKPIPLKFEEKDITNVSLNLQESAHVSVPNLTNLEETTDTDPVENVDSPDISLQSNKLSSVNDTDTYVLKNKIPEKVETDDDDDRQNVSLNLQENAQSNKLSSVNDTYVLKNKIPEKVETDDDDDSSCGLPSPNTKVDGDLLDADNKCTKTFALQEFDYKIRRMSEISNLLDNIEKQRVEITDFLENFKVRPIHIPEMFTIPEKSSSYNARDSEEFSVALPSLEEKIRKHQESCRNCWKLEIVEGDFYHFSTLYGSLVLVMQLDLESGRVINLETRNKLRENAKPISRYIMTFFLDKLSESHIKCAIGDHYDVLSLLDYVQMKMLRIHSFQKEFMTSGFTMEEDFVAKYSICSVPLALSCEIFVDVADLENSSENSKSEKDIRIATNIGVINETEIKEIVKSCPKGLDFFLSFCQNIREYLEVKEKR